jgi:hypothetical protein
MQADVTPFIQIIVLIKEPGTSFAPGSVPYAV